MTVKEKKMTVKEKEEDNLKFSFESILSETTSSIINEVEEEVDIITFCEHP